MDENKFKEAVEEILELYYDVDDEHDRIQRRDRKESHPGEIHFWQGQKDGLRKALVILQDAGEKYQIDTIKLLQETSNKGIATERDSLRALAKDADSIFKSIQEAKVYNASDVSNWRSWFQNIVKRFAPATE